MNNDADASVGTRLRVFVEVLVAASLLLALVASITATLISDQPALNRWLNKHAVVLNWTAIAECSLLFLWMCLGGQKSKLWRWVPPLCFFPTILWIRWVVVIAMIGGTLAAILAK